MGNFMYYPLEAEATSYHRREDYNALGVRRADVVKEENEIDRLHRVYCAKIFAERKTAQEKRHLLSVDDFEYTKRYQFWEADDISDFKAMFKYFDSNGDGLIDFQEMNHMLNQLGEISSEEERYVVFEKIDVDKSKTIDFEEFLMFLDRVREEKSFETPFGKKLEGIVKHGAQQINNVRQMSVYRQIANGFF